MLLSQSCGLCVCVYRQGVWVSMLRARGLGMGTGLVQSLKMRLDHKARRVVIAVVWLVCLCRQGVRVGVLSGPGHCAKGRRGHRRRNSSSLAHISHGDDGDSAVAAAAAAAAADSRKGILVQFNLPHHVSSTSNVQ